MQNCKINITAMSPSPATGLSKGEREREINSTSFGECKTVPRMYLCLVMSCSGDISALWRGALYHQGGLARPCARFSHPGAKPGFAVLVGWCRWPGVGVSCSCFLHVFAHMAHQRGCITHLSWHSQNSFYHFCTALQIVRFNLGQTYCC